MDGFNSRLQERFLFSRCLLIGGPFQGAGNMSSSHGGRCSRRLNTSLTLESVVNGLSFSSLQVKNVEVSKVPGIGKNIPPLKHSEDEE